MASIERKAVACDFKADDGGDGTFTGYGAVFGNVDLGGDMIKQGAFADSLAAWKAKGKLPNLLWQHNSRQPIGVWTSMSEDGHGLLVNGKFTKGVQAADEAYALLKDGALDGLSIGYETVDAEYIAAQNMRMLSKANLFEVSVVTMPMNPAATVTAVKSVADFDSQDWRDTEAALRDEGLSRADATKAVSGFKKWLQRDADAPKTAPRDEVAAVELRAFAARIKALTA